MPLIIGVTGSIATGKSSASASASDGGRRRKNILTQIDWSTGCMTRGSRAFDRIVGIFGEEIVGADGYIDRKVLGSKVFGKPEEMNKLTTAIGNIAEAVKGVMDEWNMTLGDNDVAVLEAVNLIEAGYGQWCQSVWLFCL